MTAAAYEDRITRLTKQVIDLQTSAANLLTLLEAERAAHFACTPEQRQAAEKRVSEAIRACQTDVLRRA